MKKDQKDQKDVMTIPELRRAFEHIEAFVHTHRNKDEADLVRALQKEWEAVFRKPLGHAEAEAYVAHVRSNPPHKQAKTRKHRQTGGAAPLAGAPLDYTVRPGLYMAPGVNQHSYAQVPAYVDKGFWNPEIAQSYDPVPGQTVYPTRTPLGMGSNLVGGGTRHKRNKQKRRRTQKGQKGGSLADALRQLAFRPFTYGSPPPSVANDAATAWSGQRLGASPDPTQTSLPYQMTGPSSGGTSAISVSTAPINLKQDIRVN